MADPQSHAQQPWPGGKRQHQQQIPNPEQIQPPKLTREELAVLNQCSSESFWYRSVPFAAVGVTLTTLAVKKGLLLPNAKVGALYKNIAVTFACYFLGKASYQEECKRKIMQLENSPLADYLRKRERQSAFGDAGFIEKQDSDVVYSTTDVPSTSSSASRDYSSNISIDTYQNKQSEGLDDKYRPTMDRDTEPRREGKEDTFTSYEELRRKNRERYQSSYQQRITSPQGSSEERPPTSQPSPKPGGRRNQYGDLIEE